MVVGMLAAAVPSGRLMSSTGRYKIFPIVGTVLVCVAALLMSTLNTGTSLVLVCVYVFLLGAGIGLTMQPLTLAVQNDFPASAVGTATSANNFFREIGSTLGTASVGSLFAHRLANQLSDRLPADATKTVGDTHSLTPALVHSLPSKIEDAVVLAYQHALTPVFRYLVPVFALGLVLAFVLPEKKLADDKDPGGTPAAQPGDTGPEKAEAPAPTGH
jgi:MFS family permease